MDTRQAVVNRIVELCKERNITPNALSYRAAVPQSTIKSILNHESLNPGIVTIKKLCDGLEISLADFFNTNVFSNLEQELT
ncbi:helix-turn-helix transcriptional regulator [Desulfosporosinus sp. SB140]|uniref:helix-turn-helix transcriptional regulator n=1 Tax=Desulfosporosinus paludis TaxID=3115649 RepID=UPI003890BB94